MLRPLMMPTPSNSSTSPDSGSPSGQDSAGEPADWEMPEPTPALAYVPRQHYRSREIPEPSSPAPVEDETPPEPPENPAPPRGAHGNRVPLERKTTEGVKPFTRFITRPETTVAATLAADRPSDRATPHPPVGTGPTFGKRKSIEEDPTYRPNRLQGVMDATWTHSRVTWFDHIGKVRFGILLAAILIGIGYIFYYSSSELHRQKIAAATSLEVVENLPPDDVRKAGIRRAFDALIAAGDVPGKLPWVLEPQRVEQRMKEYYNVRQAKDPVIAGYTVSDPLRVAGEWWFSLELTAPDGTSSTVLMKETPGGGQLDWENFVAYGSMTWAAFNQQKPAASQAMRVRLRPSKTYPPGRPEQEWAAYEITHRDGAQPLTAYALRATRHGQYLAALVKGETLQSANLYLRWVPQKNDPPSSLDSVEITDLIRNNWLDSLNSARQTPTASASPAGVPEPPETKPVPDSSKP